MKENNLRIVSQLDHSSLLLLATYPDCEESMVSVLPGDEAETGGGQTEVFHVTGVEGQQHVHLLADHLPHVQLLPPLTGHSHLGQESGNGPAHRDLRVLVETCLEHCILLKFR